MYLCIVMIFAYMTEFIANVQQQIAYCTGRIYRHYRVFMLHNMQCHIIIIYYTVLKYRRVFFSLTILLNII